MEIDNSSDHPSRKIIPFPRRRKSAPVTRKMADHIRWLYKNGMLQHDIAAHYGVNQGRVSEVITNKRFPV